MSRRHAYLNAHRWDAVRRGRKGTAASGVVGVCWKFTERAMRYLLYSGLLAAAWLLSAHGHRVLQQRRYGAS